MDNLSVDYTEELARIQAEMERSLELVENALGTFVEAVAPFVEQFGAWACSLYECLQRFQLELWLRRWHAPFARVIAQRWPRRWLPPLRCD